MKRIVEWCIRRAPNDLGPKDIYTILDMLSSSYYKRVLLKVTKCSEEELREYTPTDLLHTPINMQYPMLLAVIFAKGISCIPANEISQYICWMLDDMEIYEPSLVAYVWANSCLNSITEHKLHSAILSVVDNGCCSDILKFLWNVANSNDTFLCSVTTSIGKRIGAPKYLKAMVYTYLCSGLSAKDLALFFCDINKVHDLDMTEYCNLYCTYDWSKDIMHALFDMNYSIKRLQKYIMQLGNHGFTTTYREFPIDYLDENIFPVTKKAIVSKLPTLPELPEYYTIDRHIFNDKAPTCTYAETLTEDQKLGEWYEKLSATQKKALKCRNPVVYNACEQKMFKYVSKYLDDLLLEV